VKPSTAESPAPAPAAKAEPTKARLRAPTIVPAKPYWAFAGGLSFETRWRGEQGTFIGMASNPGIRRRYEQNELSLRLVLHFAFVPYSIKRDGTTLKPNSMSWGLALGAKHYLPSGIWLGAELEASREFVSHRMPFNGIWRDLPTDSLPWSSWLSGGFGIGYERNGVSLGGLFATVSVALTDRDYVVQDATTGEHHTLLSPWPVQPGLSLRAFF
jgi:hypothetical protein